MINVRLYKRIAEKSMQFWIGENVLYWLFLEIFVPWIPHLNLCWDSIQSIYLHFMPYLALAFLSLLLNYLFKVASIIGRESFLKNYQIVNLSFFIAEMARSAHRFSFLPWGYFKIYTGVTWQTTWHYGQEKKFFR